MHGRFRVGLTAFAVPAAAPLVVSRCSRNPSPPQRLLNGLRLSTHHGDNEITPRHHRRRDGQHATPPPLPTAPPPARLAAGPGRAPPSVAAARLGGLLGRGRTRADPRHGERHRDGRDRAERGLRPENGCEVAALGRGRRPRVPERGDDEAGPVEEVRVEASVAANAAAWPLLYTGPVRSVRRTASVSSGQTAVSGGGGRNAGRLRHRFHDGGGGRNA